MVAFGLIRLRRHLRRSVEIKVYHYQVQSGFSGDR